MEKISTQVRFGTSTLFLDTRALAPGRYFLRMKAGTYVVNEAILVLN
jgi:hypothetical protein